MSKVIGFKEFVGLPKKIRVEAPEHLLPVRPERLDEATRKTVGQHTARRDPPHFQGDEYHAHADIPGGYEVSWNISGSRRHPNKFPVNVPNDAKAAVAKALGVSMDLLETYKIQDEAIGEDVFLFSYKEP
jgi:hypothetical protein